MLRTQLVEGPSGWDEVRDAWRALSNSGSLSSHLQLFEWTNAFGRHLAADPDARWFRADDEDGPVAVLPFRTRRVLPIPARILSNYSVVSDGIVAPRADSSAIREALLAECARAGASVHALALNGLREESAWLRVVRGAATLSDEPSHGGFCTLDTTASSEEWFRSAPKNLRRTLKRRQKELAALSPCTTVATTPRDVADAFDQFVALEARGWKGTSGALANRPALRRMLQEFATDYAATGQLRIRSLWLGSTLAASEIDAGFERTVVSLKTAYNEAFAALSPGTLLMAELVKTCCDDPHVKTLDMWSNTPWHSRWGMEMHPTYQARVFDHRSVTGRIVAAAWKVRERYARRHRSSTLDKPASELVL